MRKTKYIINASNLHVGGGIQVASSFVSEIPSAIREQISVVASQAVAENISLSEVQCAEFASFEIANSNGIAITDKILRSNTQEQRHKFTVFGPLYRWIDRDYNIVGFAQPWIIYPHNSCYKTLSPLVRLRTRLKFLIQGKFFKRAHILIVELEHVKQGLIRELGIESDRIHVIHNCLSNIFLQPESWKKIGMPTEDGYINLGFLGRNYHHKNTHVFPGIAAELAKHYNIKAKFFVTFTDTEWQECTPEFRQVCVNVGPLSVAQCPSFYKALDAVVFPSLLECFSATPLETMAMEIPLFASDRPFNRDVCGDHAHYFDPLEPATAAHAIANVFAHGGPDPAALRAAREHAINFSNPKERAEKYLALLMQCAKQPNN